MQLENANKKQVHGNTKVKAQSIHLKARYMTPWHSVRVPMLTVPLHCVNLKVRRCDLKMQIRSGYVAALRSRLLP